MKALAAESSEWLSTAMGQAKRSRDAKESAVGQRPLPKPRSDINPRFLPPVLLEGELDPSFDREENILDHQHAFRHHINLRMRRDWESRLPSVPSWTEMACAQTW